MDIQVRRINEDEMGATIEACEKAFSWDVPQEDMDAWRKVMPWERTFVATDGDEIVGTGANYSFDMSVPGADAPVAGLTLVGVSPTHRRRGVLNRLMQTFLADAAEHGESMSTLWASESLIYQRYGYGMAARHMQIEVEKARMNFLADPGRQGETRFLTLDDAIKELPAVYELARRARPGMMSRDETWWREHRLRDPEHARQGASPMWRVLVDIKGSSGAYALYRAHGDWPDGNPRGKIQVVEAISTDATSARELWRFLFGIDLMETVKADFMPIDLSLDLMVTDPRRIRKRFGDNLWLRIVDVAAALRARDYRAPGSVVVEVSDDILATNEGRWRLDTLGDSVIVERCDDDPDASMHVRDLAAAYLGGNTFSALAAAGRCEERQPGTLAQMDAMFSSATAPWCPEIF